jgi:hypothetical protein
MTVVSFPTLSEPDQEFIEMEQQRKQIREQTRQIERINNEQNLSRKQEAKR